MRDATSRGPYAKGVARRQEILDAALDVLATQGLRNSTLDEIAARVGITRQGVLHYFGSREHLMLAVLETRDLYDIAAAEDERRSGATPIESLLRSVERTRKAPGLARLYTQLAAEATDPEHPAHEFFRRRYDRIRGVTATQLEHDVAEGKARPSGSTDVVAQLLPALLDGLQLQWLLDPSLDVTAALATASAALTSGAQPEGHDAP